MLRPLSASIRFQYALSCVSIAAGAEQVEPQAEHAPTYGMGVVRYDFMGKAHSQSLKALTYMMWPPPAYPRLVSICGRDAEAVREAQERYGYDRCTTDWRVLVNDPEVEIVDNLTPNNLHAEPSITAAKAGKPIICEKPLGRSAEESKAMLDAVRASGVKNICAFNYRFVPALQLARQLVERGDWARYFTSGPRTSRVAVSTPTHP